MGRSGGERKKKKVKGGEWKGCMRAIHRGGRSSTGTAGGREGGLERGIRIYALIGTILGCGSKG